MKSPSRPPTPATSLATPPRTTPPTARSAGIWSRPSSALAPRAESTANSPNRRIAHAPKEMGDHPLNMIAGKCSDWNSMCQKRRGRPRSIVRSKPERIAPTAATSYPVRMTGRSSAPPNQSKRADRKYAPPASPPTKKYGIMNQVQWGAPVKKESDISRASPGAALLVHAPLPQADERQHAQDGGARHREGGALGEVPRRQLWVPRQPVYLGFVDEEVERIEPAERPFRVGAVELGLHALRLELVDALVCARAQLGDRPELDRVRGARLRARGLEADLEPVVAERALLGRARYRIDVDHAERTRGDAGPTSVADVGLDHDGVELGADDRAGRAHLQASRLDAVLAHVAHHQPAAVVRTLELLDEADVPPVDAVQLAGVVVAVAGELPDPAVLGRELVPFLARDLARLAADANRGVGEEPHGFGHSHAFSTLQTNALPSWIDTLGSPTQEVRSLTTSPVDNPIQPQCHGMPTWWMRLPPMCITPIRCVTSALARMWPRGLDTTTQSRFLIPFSFARSCPSSMNSSGCSSASQGSQRLMAPAR